MRVMRRMRAGCAVRVRSTIRWIFLSHASKDKAGLRHYKPTASI
jgi:hypothetical protein